MTDMEYSLYCIYDTIEILKLSCENGNLIGTEHSRVAEVNSLNSGKLPGCFFFERPRYEAKWVGVWVNVCVCSQTTGRNVPTSWRMLSVNTRHWLKGQGTFHRVVCQEAPGMVHHSQGQGFKSSWKILCQVTLASASHKNESLNSVSLHVVYVAYTFVCFTWVSVPIGNSRLYMCMIWSEVVANACLVPRLSLLQPGNEARLMHEHYYVWTMFSWGVLLHI